MNRWTACLAWASALILAACRDPGPAARPAPLSATEQRETGPVAPAPLPSPFANTSIPEAPERSTPWRAPRVAGLPPKLVSSAEALFRDGLADPRGLEYRDVEVATGDVWSGTGPTAKTRAWVLPGSGPRFAVAWNGLVYPLTSVGERRSLEADVVSALRADAEQRAKHSDFTRFRIAPGEAGTLAHEGVLPIKAALLLRLGEAKLALEVWQAWTAGMRPGTNDDSIHLEDPYLMLATDWVWALFDRSVCAHMRGDDALALASARALVIVRARVEAEAEKRGFERKRQNDGKGAPYLDFLGPLDALLVDQDKRVPEARRGPMPPSGPARIAALIADLDRVDARQMSQPGGVHLGADVRVKALIQEGERAVEPLLEVLEKDLRLTRSVHFWRDFSRHRSLLGVHEAAYVALSGILQASFFEAGSTGDDLSGRGLEGRLKVASLIRAHWQKWKGVPPEERWYRTLADDRVDSALWLKAARGITQPSNLSVSPSSMAFATQTTDPSTPSTLRGEMLRKNKRPSVTELLVKRVAELHRRIGPVSPNDVLNPGSSSGGLDRACAMAEMLGAWDAKGGSAELGRMFGRVKPIHEARKGFAGAETARCLARVTLARVQGRDPAAVDAYARWIEGVTFQEVAEHAVEVVEPLWRSAGHPAAERAAEKLFAGASPWTDIAQESRVAEFLSVPMIRLGGFRKFVLRKLADTSAVGTVVVDDKKRMNVSTPGGGSVGTMVDASDPLAPSGATSHPLRVCDYVAWRLSQLEGAPKFALFWSEAARNDGVKNTAAFVARAKPPARP